MQQKKLEYTKCGEEYTKNRKDILPDIFARTEWISVEERRTVGMMPAMAIQQIINKQKGRHTHYTISHELAPFGLYGIHSEFKNASVKSYWIDSGDSVTCIAVEATSKPMTGVTGATIERYTPGICSRCGQAPAHFMPLKLCDDCHEGLAKLTDPKERRAYLEMV